MSHIDSIDLEASRWVHMKDVPDFNSPLET